MKLARLHKTYRDAAAAQPVPSLEALCSKVDRPNKEAAIEAHVSRFHMS